MRIFNKLLRDARGATAVEYGLIAALIVLAAMAAIMGVSDRAIATWNVVANNVSRNM